MTDADENITTPNMNRRSFLRGLAAALASPILPGGKLLELVSASQGMGASAFYGIPQLMQEYVMLPTGHGMMIALKNGMIERVFSHTAVDASNPDARFEHAFNQILAAKDAAIAGKQRYLDVLNLVKHDNHWWDDLPTELQEQIATILPDIEAGLEDDEYDLETEDGHISFADWLEKTGHTQQQVHNAAGFIMQMLEANPVLKLGENDAMLRDAFSIGIDNGSLTHGIEEGGDAHHYIISNYIPQKLHSLMEELVEALQTDARHEILSNAEFEIRPVVQALVKADPKHRLPSRALYDRLFKPWTGWSYDSFTTEINHSLQFDELSDAREQIKQEAAQHPLHITRLQRDKGELCDGLKQSYHLHFGLDDEGAPSAMDVISTNLERLQHGENGYGAKEPAGVIHVNKEGREITVIDPPTTVVNALSMLEYERMGKDLQNREV